MPFGKRKPDSTGLMGKTGEWRGDALFSTPSEIFLDISDESWKGEGGGREKGRKREEDHFMIYSADSRGHGGRNHH